MTGDMVPPSRGDDAVPPPAGGAILPQPDPANLRASHEDREQVIEALRVAAGDGRLTADELDQRLEVALTARTYGELTALTADLPAQAQPAGAMAAPAVPAKEIATIDCGSGNTKRVGRWVVPHRIEVRLTSGNVRLDFTAATFTSPVVLIDAQVNSGNLIMITKPGIVVDADDVALRSGNVKVKEPWGHDVPVVQRIQVSGKVGSGNIVARPRRRSFWAWLTRKPRRYELPGSR
jgi:DUF1707 SHOCT-like domain